MYFCGGDSPSSGENGDISVSCRRGLFLGAANDGESSPDSQSTPPRLVKNLSLESVLSACSNAFSSQSASPSSSRSIFPRYWELKREDRATFRPKAPASDDGLRPSSSIDRENHFTALPNLEWCEQHKTQSLSPPPPSLSSRVNRRSIFTTSGASTSSSTTSHSPPSPTSAFCTGRSTVDLASTRGISGVRPPFRKASSTTALDTRRKSCLRSVRRYSTSSSSAPSLGEESADASMSAVRCSPVGRRARSSSVSFCPRVDVIEYEKAFEVHAEEGWSDFFF